jgi:hypothetical protein
MRDGGGAPLRAARVVTRAGSYVAIHATQKRPSVIRWVWLDGESCPDSEVRLSSHSSGGRNDSIGDDVRGVPKAGKDQRTTLSGGILGIKGGRK